MKKLTGILVNRCKQFAAVCVTALTISAVLFLTLSSTAAEKKRLSQIFDTSEPYSVIGVLPDASGFLEKLREGKAQRAFFDSPLGLHFVRSAPLRGAAHLHRLISLAPRSWQWNLYSFITDGPVFYRSHGKAFVLVVALNKKGQVITSLLKDAHAARTDDLLIIASDAQTLAAQLAYLKSPKLQDSEFDGAFSRPQALTLGWQSASDNKSRRSLFRSLLQESMGFSLTGNCTLVFTPAADAIAADGACAQNTRKPGAASRAESLSIPDYPAVVHFKKSQTATAHVLALHGLQSEFGYLIPQIFFSGPSSDQKTLEFLSQAFKTRRHVLENADGAIRVKYPYPYAYADKKFELFSPHLAANRERFYWQSFLPAKKTQQTNLEIDASHDFDATIKIYPLLKNSEAALKQFDAIYSPGHFNEFRDALFKSAPALQRSVLRIFTESQGNKLRIAGSLTFADA